MEVLSLADTDGRCGSEQELTPAGSLQEQKTLWRLLRNLQIIHGSAVKAEGTG